jgi:hypothetical protein
MFKTWLKYFPPYLFSIICMKNVLFLSHLQTHLDIIVFFKKKLSYSHTHNYTQK